MVNLPGNVVIKFDLPCKEYDHVSVSRVDFKNLQSCHTKREGQSSTWIAFSLEVLICKKRLWKDYFPKHNNCSSEAGIELWAMHKNK